MRMTTESTPLIYSLSESKSKQRKNWNDDIKLLRNDFRRSNGSKNENSWDKLRSIDLRSWNESNFYSESKDKRSSWSNWTRTRSSLKKKSIKSLTQRSKNSKFSESRHCSMQNTNEQRYEKHSSKWLFGTPMTTTSFLIISSMKRNARRAVRRSALLATMCDEEPRRFTSRSSNI